MTKNLDKAVWDKLRRKVGETAHVRVGVLAEKGGSASHDSSGITLAELATVHEFGSPAMGIPERSFIRRTMNDHRDEFVKLSAQLAEQIFESHGMTMRRALDVLGAKFAAETKKTITVGPGVPPPNAPATIAAKGSSRPLVGETGRLVQSISWVVVDGAA